MSPSPSSVKLTPILSCATVFIDAPHVLQPADLPGGTAQSSGTNLASFGASEAANANEDPALTPRAWWKVNADKTVAYGLREAIEVVRDVLKARTFDGVLGFSQGAAFASIISSLLERPHLYEPFLVDGKPPHPPFKFCVAVSGFRLRDPFCDSLYEPQYTTPTLHVIGKNDVIVHEERSRLLVDASANARVEEHDGGAHLHPFTFNAFFRGSHVAPLSLSGHFMPSKRNWLKFIRGYMVDPSADLPSPSLAASSAPASGTATPTELSATTIMKL
ncbi:hypothetical protein DXG03_004033 [Asterophora parasitica]|uniref:Serine hydrolase domain-containing protein n=1 Tax=Asterophora parasitica TaxID=117018 RepID=A0A9P7GFI1_9AGAR|nr:hypothetical protein DXG03_004033 [Asterophora parasitica]